VPVHELHFRDCRVPAENLLGGVENLGFKNAMMTLDRARPGVAARNGDQRVDGRWAVKAACWYGVGDVRVEDVPSDFTAYGPRHPAS